MEEKERGLRVELGKGSWGHSTSLVLGEDLAHGSIAQHECGRVGTPVPATEVKMRCASKADAPPGKQQPSGLYQKHAFLYSKQFLT